MEEYEYLTANTLEAWRTIVDAISRGDFEIKRSLVRSEKDGRFAVSVVWDLATHIENGREYRWKKSSPLDIGSDPGGSEALRLGGNPTGTIPPKKLEDRQPMQKEIEVEG